MNQKTTKTINASEAARHRLDGVVKYFDAACLEEDAEAMERRRAEAHAAVDAMLDAKAAAWGLCLEDQRRQQK